MSVFRGVSFFITCLFTLAAQLGIAQTLKTKMDTISYAAGVSIATSFQRHGAGDVDLDIMTKAIHDVMGKQNVALPLDKALCERIFNQYITDVKSKPGKDFLFENSKRKGVIQTSSGLQYEVLKKSGSEQKPTVKDDVKTHYTGKLIDGKVFDSSLGSGEPASFPVSKVIKGWTEGLQLMSVGDKYIFYIPHELGYGERGVAGKIGPYATLIFEVELLEIERK